MSCFSNIEQQHPRENFATEFLGDISLIISEDTVEKITETRITQVSFAVFSVILFRRYSCSRAQVRTQHNQEMTTGRNADNFSAHT